MTNFIARAQMPQIDEADMTALVEWLTWKGIDVVTVERQPDQLRFHQKVSWSRVHRMDAETYAKPIWVSADGYVLDGSHRAWAHKLKGEPIKCLLVALPFFNALEALLSFSGSYTYSDGKPHAER